MVQDFRLFFFVNLIVSTGFTWVVWGFMAGSIMMTPSYFQQAIQDYLLVFLVHILVTTNLSWTVWGLMVCSLLSPPSLSFGSHLVLTLVLPLVIVVGSYAGFGNFDNNSGCFSLLLVVVYWWSFHLLPLLGHHVLSLILAPPWSGHSNSTGYCQGHTVHKFP
jgi:hypothetical protein